MQPPRRIVVDVMIDDRIAKTLAKLRGGDLPASTVAADNMFLESIYGTVCSGCGEPIKHLQGFYSVRVRRANTAPLRFHPGCHSVWSTFNAVPGQDKNPPSPDPATSTDPLNPSV